MVTVESHGKKDKKERKEKPVQAQKDSSQTFFCFRTWNKTVKVEYSQ